MLFLGDLMEHIYIHWPFCRQKCAYCDFTSFTSCDKFEKEYCTALCNEITSFAQKESKIKTIFLGGGSPSLCSQKSLEAIFKTIYENFLCDDLIEVTIEANPADISREKLQFWRQFGINRLSMGVQILDDDVLQKINRRQKTRDVYNAMELAPQYFENISVDLILGLPDVSEKTWFQTLQTVTKFPIKHVSVYFLTLYEKTPLACAIKTGKIKALSDDAMVETYEETVSFLEEKGLKQYEISNFAHKEHESLHNQAYWDYKKYRGFGVSAASFDGDVRCVNTKSLKTYLACWGKNEDCDKKYDLIEQLNDEQKRMEQVMLLLRQKKKGGLQRMIYLVGAVKNARFLRTLSALKSQLLLEEKNGDIFLTSRGMALENEVVLKLLG